MKTTDKAMDTMILRIIEKAKMDGIISALDTIEQYRKMDIDGAKYIKYLGNCVAMNNSALLAMTPSDTAHYHYRASRYLTLRDELEHAEALGADAVNRILFY